MAVTIVDHLGFRPLSTPTATVLRSIPPHFLSSAAHTALLMLPTRVAPFAMVSNSNSASCSSLSCNLQSTKAFVVPRRSLMSTLILSSCLFSQTESNFAFAQPTIGFKEYIDSFDGYSFDYPKNWIQVRGANADIFFRDPYVLDENLSVEVSSPSSSKYKSVEDLGPPEEAGKAVLRQYLTEFMSTRLGVKRESSILSTSSTVADDGKMYYQIEVNIKSFASNNELAVMPEDRVVRMEWNRRYLSVLGVENNQLYELRLQVPENVFVEEENDLRKVMASFRVNKLSA
ncbi:psbP domain-containing protein 1, chloroplastic [Lactuca sativa]|uniref:PsbP C-terminal domain-containing protein n=1 Tax=Lactuca sativa TaxID=4236 RepID=A0A9R1X317_LACSA|nr:psbP domain-containing protein 1, chloroplastic [Lactuca sativa]KAJ0197346.1 hypothetical protein LSAT_V11C700368140 [Lactuca sativa]